MDTEHGRVASDRAGGLRPEPAAQSQPVGAHPSREKAEAEARKREAHKRPGLNGKRWEAVHDSVRGWHVALVDEPHQAAFAASMRARQARMSGDPRWLDLAAEALMARVRRDLSRDSDASLAEDAQRLSPEGVAARAEGIAQPQSVSDPTHD